MLIIVEAEKIKILYLVITCGRSVSVVRRCGLFFLVDFLEPVLLVRCDPWAASDLPSGLRL
jgi:hypothetical protein